MTNISLSFLNFIIVGFYRHINMLVHFIDMLPSFITTMTGYEEGL